jgi:hypothetical protein
MNLEPARQPEADVAAARRPLLQVIGLQRSGNHAIITWLSSLFPRTAHFNDMDNDYFRTATDLGERLAGKEDCLVFSFEDSLGKGSREGNLLERIELGDPARFPGFDFRVIYILRDPYNCWASRAKAKEERRLTCSASLPDFMRDWIAIARLWRQQEDAFILYNSWFKSQEYRKRVCARLGGEYSERTLGDVFAYGGGSSFEGYARPSYGTILRRIDYYTSPDFRRRFLKQPRTYLNRLFAPSLDGRQLKVESRFEHLLGQPDSRPLFENEEIAALSREIFGFSVDASGRMTTARAQAPRG